MAKLLYVLAAGLIAFTFYGSGTGKGVSQSELEQINAISVEGWSTFERGATFDERFGCTTDSDCEAQFGTQADDDDE